MKGYIGQTVSIAAYAKAFLRGNDISFNLEHSTSKNCRKIEFVLEETDSSNKTIEILLAHSVMEWFTFIKRKGIADVTLHYQPLNKNGVPDRYNGGGRWVIETNQKGISNIWNGKWDIVGKPPETRLWGVTYSINSRSESRLYFSIRPLEEVRQELFIALEEILKFAEDHKKNILLIVSPKA